MNTSKICLFLNGKIPDHKGRYLNDILSLSDFWLEHDHEYIQCLFPMDEGHKFNSHAPLVTARERDVFNSNKLLQASHRRCLDRVLAYYGLTRLGGLLAPVGSLNKREHPWLKPRDHAHLRFTRIIRSLTLLGQHNLAKSLVDELIRIGEKHGSIDKNVYTYWRKATILD